ncbi:MAG: FtsX-like permease family protein [Ruminococcus sp.]|nr:FtsX-like permease family protein [Ruminococcus sp.]
MKYEKLLASRYIKAQKRQSAFTVISITAAVAVMTMIFVLYSVYMDCMHLTVYSSKPWHFAISDIPVTEEQGESIRDMEHVRRLKLFDLGDGMIRAEVLFDGDIGDRVIWQQQLEKKLGIDKRMNNVSWNDSLMNYDGIGPAAHLHKLRIFCLFFMFAVFMAFALRLVVDTAFEVSSKERERHYGVLQSVGATPEQIVRIITSEGMKLCLTAVPLGLIAGIGFAFLMYKAVLAAGIAELFESSTEASFAFPFRVDPLMLLVAAAVGIIWVFLSAYGVGMRVIKKSPMEAITARANDVEKVRKRSLSGLLFGISGSIASRNARRQKKRFVITVLTLTVSISMFAMFSSFIGGLESSIKEIIRLGANDYSDVDFTASRENGTFSATEATEKLLGESGLFKDIGVGVSVNIYARNGDFKDWLNVLYVNKTQYERMFGEDPPVSYEELAAAGGYIANTGKPILGAYISDIDNGVLNVVSVYRKVPEDKLAETADRKALSEYLEVKETDRQLDIIGTGSKEWSSIDLIGAKETYDAIADEWYGNYNIFTCFEMAYIKEECYTNADLDKVTEWFKEHSADLTLENCQYEDKTKVHYIMAAVKVGLLILNVFIGLVALINLMNIISTGIANRRSELASMQCIGMTDRQLRRMAVIEVLQFTGAAAIASAVICWLFIFGSEKILIPLLSRSFMDDDDETRQILTKLISFKGASPFILIALASLAAFAAGCVTSLIMLRAQDNESLADQIRGSEMKLDTKKTHILRNSIIAAAGIAVLAVAGLRTYSVISYRNGRKEYEKAGYLNLVDSNGFRMNVYSTGAEHGKHTIVGMAGMGVQAYPILTKQLNEQLGRENTLVYPDRAGYGFSDDSYKEQNVEQVVEDYRTGLKNAGFEAPYVLMPHSWASYYAFYWENKYPDEVEAIIFMDCTWLPKNEMWRFFTADNYPSMADARSAARRLFLRTWLGLDTFSSDSDPEDIAHGRSLFTEEETKLRRLAGSRQFSAANLSSLLLEEQDTLTVLSLLKPTDTPKLSFSATPGCEEDVIENYRFRKADYEAAGLEYNIDPETAGKAEWRQSGKSYQQFFEKDIKSFWESCGNCRTVNISGEHDLFFSQNAEKVAGIINDFLAEIE